MLEEDEEEEEEEEEEEGYEVGGSIGSFLVTEGRIPEAGELYTRPCGQTLE